MLGDLDLPQPAVEDPVTYVRRMTELGCTVDAWETTYVQDLSGENPVLEWMSGTALRPVIDRLSAEAWQQ